MKKRLLIILGLLSLVGIIVGISTIVDKKDDGLKKINPTFVQGTLNQTGQWVESKSSIYTKDMFECQGLEVTLDFEHNINYEVFYYDKDGRFIEKTGLMDDKYINEDLSRVFARIVITPDWSLIDTNTEEVEWYEVNKYASQLNLKVNKVQREYNLLTCSVVYNDGESVTIYFEDGMTWGEFINSKFNNLTNLEIEESNNLITLYSYYCINNDKHIKSDDILISNNVYNFNISR